VRTHRTDEEYLQSAALGDIDGQDLGTPFVSAYPLSARQRGRNEIADLLQRGGYQIFQN
jgi:hypothetical protein